jgi:protein-tyrosine-phosphatase
LSVDDEDIPDPAGGTVDDYRICASRIETALEERIREL